MELANYFAHLPAMSTPVEVTAIDDVSIILRSALEQRISTSHLLSGRPWAGTRPLPRRLPSAELAQLLARCELFSAGPGFALQAGASFRKEDAPPQSPSVEQSPSIDAAAASLQHLFAGLHMRPPRIAVQTADTQLRCSFEVPADLTASQPLVDYVLSRAAAIIHTLAPALHVMAVEVPFAEPPHAAEYARILRVPVRFDAASPALVLAINSREHEPLTDRVRREILTQLRQGQVSFTSVAVAVGHSERTLRRQLRAQGTSYQSLLDDERKAIALRHLSNTANHVTQLGAILGFSEPASFYRAFRRWTGQAVSEYRRALSA
jgi:AraC-like DNA-binding protein